MMTREAKNSQAAAIEAVQNERQVTAQNLDTNQREVNSRE
jgi:hypothetical protein